MQQTHSLSYTFSERLKIARPKDRIPSVMELTCGKVVLDVGCFDETALFKRGTGTWLHEEIAKVAREVIGVDSSAKIPEAGLETSHNSRIVRGDVAALSDVDLARVDVVVAGEIIEHLPNTLEVLRQLAAHPDLKGKPLVVTTPNATAFFNLTLALVGRESQHPDHLQVYSFKTLNTLFERAGFSKWALFPYHAYYTQVLMTSRGLMGVLSRTFQAISRGVESAFPLLSGGWLAVIEI